MFEFYFALIITVGDNKHMPIILKVILQWTAKRFFGISVSLDNWLGIQLLNHKGSEFCEWIKLMSRNIILAKTFWCTVDVRQSLQCEYHYSARHSWCSMSVGRMGRSTYPSRRENSTCLNNPTQRNRHGKLQVETRAWTGMCHRRCRSYWKLIQIYLQAK